MEKLAFSQAAKAFENERSEFINEKAKLKSAAKRVNASTYGQEKLIQSEVKKRVNELMGSNGVGITHFTDEDHKALEEFN